MHNSKVAILLRALNDREVKRLHQFCRSQYFNTDLRLTQLLNFYLEFTPKYQDDNLNLVNAFRKCYPQEEFNKSKIIKLISRLFLLVKKFVVTESPDYFEDVRLLKFYNKKKLHALFDSDFKKIIRPSSGHSIRNHRYLLKNFLLLMEEGEHISATETAEKVDIKQINKSFDHYMIAQKLYLFLQQLNREEMMNLGSSLTFKKSVEEYISDPLPEDKPVAIHLWSLIYRFYIEEDKITLYKEIKKHWSSICQLYDNDEARFIFTLLENKIQSISKNQNEFYTEFFTLFQVQIEHNILSEDEEGALLPETFNNLFSVALKLKKLEWAENFFKRYKDKLVSGNREDILNLCLAKLHFEKGDFDASLALINQCSFKNSDLKRTSRIAKLKLYYELSLHSLISDFIISYRKFISVNKNRLNKTNVEMVLPFITAVNKIYFSNADTDFNTLQNEIEEAKFFLEKDWLLEKIAEKKKQFKIR